MLSDLDDNKILRYLESGYDDKTLADIARLKKQLLEMVNPRGVCIRFEIERAGGDIRAGGITLIGGNIRTFLGEADECWILAATLGAEADRLIAYTQRKSVADGLIVDATASALIEAYCDELQSGLPGGLRKYRRYSCGYGDLPIELQPAFLSAVDAGRAIGLYCSRENIMTPRKSITAVIVNLDEACGIYGGCAGCRIESKCELRKAGDYCGR